MVGYTGGKVDWPDYKCIRDHTEAVHVVYNPNMISFSKLLDHLFHIISPFQGYRLMYPKAFKEPIADGARQYIPAIWYNGAEQKQALEAKMQQIQKAKGRKPSIYCAPLGPLYRGESYHQHYLKSVVQKKKAAINHTCTRTTTYINANDVTQHEQGMHAIDKEDTIYLEKADRL